MKWHQKFSHLHERARQDMARSDPPVLNGFDYNLKQSLGDCVACLASKAKSSPYLSSTTKPTKGAEIIAFDLGEFTVRDHCKCKYYIAGTDQFIGFTF